MVADTDGKVTRHFRLVEFHCHDGSPVPDLALAGLTVLCQWWLEPLRKKFGPVTVLSGYRSEPHNAQVGGASGSYHLYHKPRHLVGSKSRHRPVAADVKCATGTPLDWAKWARAHRATNPHLQQRGRGGIGLYQGQGFVHLDTGPSREWTG